MLWQEHADVFPARTFQEVLKFGDNDHEHDQMWEHPCLIYRALVSNDSLQLGYVAKRMFSEQQNI